MVIETWCVCFDWLTDWVVSFEPVTIDYLQCHLHKQIVLHRQYVEQMFQFILKHFQILSIKAHFIGLPVQTKQSILITQEQQSNFPWFSSETWALYKSVTYLLTYLLTLTITFLIFNQLTINLWNFKLHNCITVKVQPIPSLCFNIPQVGFDTKKVS